MSDDLAVRCTARLDEMRRTAEAANFRGLVHWHSADGLQFDLEFCREDAAFIASFDPASVLRLVAGLREILDEHHPHQGYDEPITFCVTCDNGGAATTTLIERYGRAWPCGTVRSVASALGIEEKDARPECEGFTGVHSFDLTGTCRYCKTPKRDASRPTPEEQAE